MEIAVDSSTLIAFFNGDKGEDVEQLSRALASRRVRLPPLVISEIFSSAMARTLEREIEEIPLLPIREGYWRRAADIRCLLLEKKLKARLADALICQSCLDADMPLITRDVDFRHYVKWAGLKLAA